LPGFGNSASMVSVPVRVDLAADDRHRPALRKDRSVGEDQLQGAVLHRLRVLVLRLRARVAQVALLGDRNHRFDRIELRDGGQDGGGTDQIADLGDGDAGNARDRRGHLRPREVQLRLLDRGAGGLDGRLVGLVRLHRVVELLLADRALRGERRVARDVELGLDQRRLRLRQVAALLVQLRLELARVDLEEQLTGLDDVALLVVLGQEVALHLRADLGVDEAGRGADPLLVDGHVLLLDLGDQHVHRWGRLRRLRLPAAGADQRERDEQRRSGGASLHETSPCPRDHHFGLLRVWHRARAALHQANRRATTSRWAAIVNRTEPRSAFRVERSPPPRAAGRRGERGTHNGRRGTAAP
jgi:hypothetical protein